MAISGRLTLGKCIGTLWKKIKRNLLLALTFLAVVSGFSVGLTLRSWELSPQTIEFIIFPGDVLMRMLKMMIIPLIVSSLVAGLATIDRQSCSRMGSIAVCYYVTTTLCAATLGIILVTWVEPGHPDIKHTSRVVMGNATRQRLSTSDSLMDLARNMFPPNLLQATFQTAHTIYYNETVYRQVPVPPDSHFQLSPDDTSSEQAEQEGQVMFIKTQTLSPQQMLSTPDSEQQKMMIISEVRIKKRIEYTDGVNSLGLIVFSMVLGVSLASIGEEAEPIIHGFTIMNEAVLKIVSAIMWYSPVGISFLIAGKILQIEAMEETAKSLARYVFTVCLGLFLHSNIVLCGLYALLTRKNPYTFFIGVSQAWFTALGTASSSATLPVTFKCLEENIGIDRRVTRFVLPIGATINMDGTALYEAIAAIFVAQVNDVPLDFAKLATVSLTATAASIGAASVPGAGLVTMVLVLTAIGLPTDDVILILSVDWLLDRIRTSVNVLGDAYCAGIVYHWSRRQQQKKTPPRMKLSDSMMDQLRPMPFFDTSGNYIRPGNPLIPISEHSDSGSPHLIDI